MSHTPRTALAQARHMAANPTADVPLAVRQCLWHTLKLARGQSIDLDRIDRIARKNALACEQRKARISARVAALCAARSLPYHGPTGGTAT